MPPERLGIDGRQYHHRPAAVPCGIVEPLKAEPQQEHPGKHPADDSSAWLERFEREPHGVERDVRQQEGEEYADDAERVTRHRQEFSDDGEWRQQQEQARRVRHRHLVPQHGGLSIRNALARDAERLAVDGDGTMEKHPCRVAVVQMIRVPARQIAVRTIVREWNDRGERERTRDQSRATERARSQNGVPPSVPVPGCTGY